jgi:hypothetical protein
MARSRSRSMHRGGKDKGEAKGKGKKGTGKDGQVLFGVQRRVDTMIITIEPTTRSGDTIYVPFTLGVESADTIAYVKRQIQDYLGVRPACQRLKFLGRPLEEMHTLSYYSIVAESVVHLRWDRQGQEDVDRHV